MRRSNLLPGQTWGLLRKKTLAMTSCREVILLRTLTAEQYALLRQLSREQKKPVSVLIREAVERVYFKQAALQRRRVALKSLLSLDAPVADWEQMEEEIINGGFDS